VQDFVRVHCLVLDTVSLRHGGEEEGKCCKWPVLPAVSRLLCYWQPEFLGLVNSLSRGWLFALHMFLVEVFRAVSLRRDLD
jgi:hypothetical protein